MQKHNFFCIGKNVKSNPEIFSQIIQSGHRIGNHTFFHKNGWMTNTQDYINDVSDAAKVIQSDLFRPPYGRIKKSQAEMLLPHYKIIMWDVLSYDFSPQVNPQQCYKNVTNHTRAGSIIVFHDSIKALQNVKETLPRFLEFLLKNNFIPSLLP